MNPLAYLIKHPLLVFQFLLESLLIRIAAFHWIELTDDFVVEPIAFLKYVSPAPIQFEGTLKVTYKEKVWLSGTYRDKDAITASLGFFLNNSFTVAYAHDFTTTNLKNYSDGTHELMIGARFYSRKNKEKTAPKME